MPQTPEAKVKNWVRSQILKRYPTAWIYMAPGGPYGRRGVPDMLCSICGLFIAIEVKSDVGKLTANQKIEIDKLRLSNAICVVVRGKNLLRLDALFTIIDRELDHVHF